MRRMKGLVRNLGVCTTVAVMALSLGGCNRTQASGSQGELVANSSDTTDKIKVSVGIGNIFVPFCYLDDDENPAGYDYEVLCAVKEKLADKYEFVITPDEFGNLLIGLDIKKYDMAVHHFGYTSERAANYLYAEEPDMYFGSFHVGYLKGRTDITDLASCAGLTVATTSGSMAEGLLLNWNEENPDQAVKLEYAADLTVIAVGLQNGLYDAFVASEYDLDRFSAQYDNFLEYSDYNVTPEGYDDGAYFIYPKGSEALQIDIDAAIVALREEGVLSEISQTFLEKDYAIK